MLDVRGVDLLPDPVSEPRTLADHGSGGDQAPERRVPALDGLRGIAVALVVIYHLAPDRFPGGFLGVSVFFVLSGYLITSLLFAESSGRSIGLRRFWSRRFRRLLPAALVGLALAVGVAAAVGDPHQLVTLPGDVASAAAYVANWHFISQGAAYGIHYQQPSVVQHFWSLAIEEQFYIVVALLAFGLARCSASRRTWAAVFGALALGSMAVTVALGPTAHTAIYYGTGSRAFELLAGALLAIAVRGRVGRARPWGRRTPRRLVQLLGATALVTVVAAGAVIRIGDPIVYRGGLWIVAGLTALVVFALRVPGPLGRLLSWRPLVALGVVSYGVYLFHWPLFILISDDTVHGPVWLVPTVRLAATAVAAVASYVLIEQPVRLRRWALPPVRVAAVLGVSFLVLIGSSVLVGAQATNRALVAAPDIAIPTPTTLAPAAVASADAAPRPGALPPDLLADPEAAAIIDAVQLDRAPPPEPTTIDPPRDTLDHVLVMGDSMMQDAFPAMRADFAGRNITATSVGAPAQTLMTNRGHWLVELERAVQTDDPDVVVLESCCGDEQPFTLPSGRVVASDDPAFWVAWSVLTHVATDIAASRGARVMWVLPPPADGVKSLWYGDIRERMQKVADIERALVGERPDVQLVDWSVFAGPDGGYSATMVDRSGADVTVRAPDGVHFSPAGQALEAEATVQQVVVNWTAAGGRTN